jgi:carboxyl-terminal processing protease
LRRIFIHVKHAKLRVGTLLSLLPALILLPVVSSQETETPTEPEPEAEVDLTVQEALADFDAAWNIISQDFYHPEFAGVDWEAAREEYRPRVESAENAQAAYEILATMVDSLGSESTGVVPPWEVPSAPDEPEDDEGPLLEYGGVGILLSRTTEGEILVLQVFRETPAEEAGALVGDIIVGVDDWRVEGEDAMDQVVSRVRGVVGTDVDLTLRDPDGEERTVTITRGRIDLRPSVEARVLESGAGYIRVPVLTEELVDEASRSLPNLLSTRNMILDLRGVSSGNLEAMSTLARWFLGSTQLGGFLTQGGAQALPFEQNAIAAYRNTMTVLTDPGTSGVPEILAAILSSYRRAGIVGGRTAGGMEFARVTELPTGGLLGVSVARYITPEGELAPSDGLDPDVPVELPDLATVRSGRDVYIEAAVEAMQDSPRW